MKQALHGDAQEIPGGQSRVCSAALRARILPRRVHDHAVEALLRAVCNQGMLVKASYKIIAYHADTVQRQLEGAVCRVSTIRDRSR